MLSLCNLYKFCQRIGYLLSANTHTDRGFVAFLMGTVVGGFQRLGLINGRMKVRIQPRREPAHQRFAVCGADPNRKVSDNGALSFL